MTDEFSVTVTFSKEALESIKKLPGLMGIPGEFAKVMIENSLSSAAAEFDQNDGGEIKFKVHPVYHVRPRWG